MSRHSHLSQMTKLYLWLGTLSAVKPMGDGEYIILWSSRRGNRTEILRSEITVNRAAEMLDPCRAVPERSVT